MGAGKRSSNCYIITLQIILSDLQGGLLLQKFTPPNFPPSDNQIFTRGIFWLPPSYILGKVFNFLQIDIVFTRCTRRGQGGSLYTYV